MFCILQWQWWCSFGPLSQSQFSCCHHTWWLYWERSHTLCTSCLLEQFQAELHVCMQMPQLSFYLASLLCVIFFVFYVTGSVSSLPPSPVSWGMDISQVQLRPCWIITAITEQFVECSKSCSNTNWSIVMALNHPLSKWEQFGSESAFKTGKVFCRSSVYRQQVLNGRCNFTASVKGWDTTVSTLHDSSLTVT